MLYQYLYKSTEESLLVSTVYSEIQENVAEFVVSVVVQFTWCSLRRKQVTDRHSDKGWFVEVVNLRQRQGNSNPGFFSPKTIDSTVFG